MPWFAAAVREAAPGAVVVTNSDWHEAQLAEQRLPLRAAKSSHRGVDDAPQYRARL